jgi:general secretion pathway protein I
MCRVRESRSSAAGFSLIEVLVALAVVSIALGALVGSSSSNINTVAALRDRTVAQWVASNIANNYHIQSLWPETGTSEGVVEMANATWRWRVNVDATQVAEIRRLEISVLRDAETLTKKEFADQGAALVDFLRRDLTTEPL